MNPMLIWPILILAQTAPPPPSENVTAQLDALAQEVANRLANPVKFDSQAREAWYQYKSDLRLASVWPRPEFREPLLRILKSDLVRDIPAAAQGLLNYGDEELNEQVRALRNDGRTIPMGCFSSCVGSDIEDLILEFERGVHFRDMDDGSLLPLTDWTPDVYGFDESPAGDGTPGLLTVDDAIEALSDDSLSIRLQAFAWLADHGIVIDTRPLLEAWPEMTDEEREELLSSPSAEPRLGIRRLRSALERIFHERDEVPISQDVFCFLLLQLAKLESPLVHDAAIEAIQKLETQEDVGNDFPDPFAYMFDALWRFVRPEDIDRALAWSQSPNERIRAGGFAVLVTFDDPRAVDAVTDYMLNPDIQKRPIYWTDPLDVICHREWPNARHKWHYIRTIIQIAQSPPQPTTRFWEVRRGYYSIDLIRALEGITGKWNGPYGYVGPLGWDPKTANKTIANWAKWVEANDPYQR